MSDIILGPGRDTITIKTDYGYICLARWLTPDESPRLPYPYHLEGYTGDREPGKAHPSSVIQLPEGIGRKFWDFLLAESKARKNRPSAEAIAKEAGRRMVEAT